MLFLYHYSYPCSGRYVKHTQVIVSLLSLMMAWLNAVVDILAVVMFVPVVLEHSVVVVVVVRDSVRHSCRCHVRTCCLCRCAIVTDVVVWCYCIVLLISVHCHALLLLLLLLLFQFADVIVASVTISGASVVASAVTVVAVVFGVIVVVQVLLPSLLLWLHGQVPSGSSLHLIKENVSICRA